MKHALRYNMLKPNIQEENRQNLFTRALTGRANTYTFIGKYDASITDHQEAIAFCRDHLQDNVLEADMTMNLAGFFGEGKSDFNTAQKLVKQTFKMIDRKKEPMIYAHGLQVLGNIYKNRGALSEALKYYHKCLAIYRLADDKTGVGGVLCNIGLICRSKGEFGISARHLKEYLRISRKIGDMMGTARALINIGVIFSIKRNFTMALKYLKKSFAISEKIGHKMGIGIALGELGLVHKSKGALNQALKYYNRYLVISKEIGFKMGISIVSTNIGDIYYEKGNFEKALEHYRKALFTSEAMKDREGIAIVLFNIGKINTKKRKYREAIQCCKSALEIFNSMRKQIEIRDTCYQLALIYSAMGRPGLAFTYYRKYYLILRQTSSKKNISTARKILRAIKKGVRINE